MAQPGKNRAVYGILLMVFIFFIILIIFASYTVKMMGQGELDIKGLKVKKEGDKIGVVEVNGAIMESKPTIELLRLAEEDDDVKAIIVRVNSPGGAVAPTQEIYEEMRRIDTSYNAEKKEGKPVYASFSSIAASGGYYIGAAARKIYSSPGTLTGSIGVIMNFMELTKLYEWAKVNPKIIKSGRYKDIGSTSRPMTEEEKSILTGMTENVHKQFINDILKTRKKKIKEDIFELAQGQIFSGEEAFKKGLVDELKGLWEAGRSIHSEMKLAGDFDFKFIKKKKKKNFLEIVESLEEVITNLDWKTKLQGPMFLAK